MSPNDAVVPLVEVAPLCEGPRTLAVCSAVVVRPRFAVTAAHCVEARWPGLLAIRAPDGRHHVVDVRLPRGRRPDGAHDVAVLLLDRPASTLARLALSRPPPGATVSLVGHGAGKGAWSRAVRVASAKGPLRLVGPDLSVPGDSGGGVFYQGELVGLVARGDQTTFTEATSVPDEAPFLARAMARRPGTSLSRRAAPATAGLPEDLPPGRLGKPCQESADCAGPCLRHVDKDQSVCHCYRPRNAHLMISVQERLAARSGTPVPLSPTSGLGVVVATLAAVAALVAFNLRRGGAGRR